MCGIAAIINISGTIDIVPAIKDMTDIIRHRGPDDEGFAIFPGRTAAPEFLGGRDTPKDCFLSQYGYAPKGEISEVAKRAALLAFGHRRLSITDLSPAGHQPMCSQDGRYSMVFNGEIYNHLTLRHELELLGERFVTNSDAEVLLAAFRKWGTSCLHRFNGMFAFVIYDSLEHRLFAARDRFGVKPFYYWRSPLGFLAIASEIKQFTVLPGWKAILNKQRAYDYLRWAISDHTNETLFSGVYQLRGGEFIEQTIESIEQGLSVHSWYTLKPKKFSGNFAEAASAFRELFSDAVKLRMQADVPVGTGLSGGLDSSSIVCVVNNILKAQPVHSMQNTFSACSTIKRFDERDFIDEVVKSCNVSAKFIYPSLQDLTGILPKLTWHQDEPFLSTSIYAEWSVFNLVRQTDVKVTLDGHGADELLAGYHSFFEPHFAGLLRSMKIKQLFHEILAARRIHGHTTAHAPALILHNLLPEKVLRFIRRISGRGKTHESWLNTGLLDLEGESHLSSPYAVPTSVNLYSSSLMAFTSLPVQLHWADRDSMAHSIEARAPFLDYRLVEFISGLPEEYKLADGITKKILREAMVGILPEKIRNRMDKMGFVTPEEVWIRQTDPEGFRQAVRRAVERSQGLFMPETIGLADDYISGKPSKGVPVWRIVNFAAWMEQFGVSLG